MNRRLAVATILAAVAACQVLATATASAHAQLESSTPAAGTQVAQLPELITLTFTENVGRPATLAVIDPDGDAIQIGDPEIVDRTLRQQVDIGEQSTGSYTISYQVTSADGHPISGTFEFVVGTIDRADPAPSATPPADADNDGLVTVLLLTLIAGGLAIAVTGIRRAVVRVVADGAP